MYDTTPHRGYSEAIFLFSALQAGAVSSLLFHFVRSVTIEPVVAVHTPQQRTHSMYKEVQHGGY